MNEKTVQIVLKMFENVQHHVETKFMKNQKNVIKEVPTEQNEVCVLLIVRTQILNITAETK